MLKVVIDTNILVSGLLKTPSIPRSILDLVFSEKILACYNNLMFAEYREVLTRLSFGFNSADVEQVLFALKTFGINISTETSFYKLPDPDDLPFLETALSAKAQFLITGNKKHFPGIYRGLKITTPTKFLSSIGE